MIRPGCLFLSSSLLVLAVAAGGWIPVPAAHAGPDATPRLSLPAPTGPHRVGTTSLHLIDDSRTDPLAPTPRVRELMVRLWYPAAAQSRQPAAADPTPGVASVSVDFLRAVTGVDLPTDLLSFPTHSLEDAPALPGTRRPVVLFSHGLGISAALNTALHEELASWGYVVAGIDHTFDCAVEFPDGRVETQKPGLRVDDLLREVRAADLSFVLDQLTALAAGHNPDAEHRPLPGAAESVREGLDETLTVLTLNLSPRLRRSLATTNAAESLLSRTRHVKRNVKRWRNGQMMLRWVAAGVLEAVKGFRRVKGYADMPMLVAALRARDRQLGLVTASEERQIA